MKSHPPRIIERIAGWLIPPACREHVLGDLHERYTSTPRYLVELARLIPLLIFSQVRRMSDARDVLMEAIAIYAALVGSAWALGEMPAFYQPHGGLRLAIPVATTLIALVLANAYAVQRSRPLAAALRDAALGASALLLSQVALAVSGSDLRLPQAVAIYGAGESLMLISVLRTLFPPGANRVPALASGDQSNPPQDSITPDDVRQKAEAFQRRIAGRNRREYFSSAVAVAVFGFYAWYFPDMPRRLGASLVVAGTLYMAFHLHKRGSADPPHPGLDATHCLRFYRTQLERQRDLLRSIWLWCLLPVLPGLVIFALGSTAVQTGATPLKLLNAIPLVLMLVAFWLLNHRAANALQREIDAIGSPHT